MHLNDFLIHISFLDNYAHRFVLVCSVSELATRPATFLKQFGHFQFGLFCGLKILKDLVKGPNMHRKNYIWYFVIPFRKVMWKSYLPYYYEFFNLEILEQPTYIDKTRAKNHRFVLVCSVTQLACTSRNSSRSSFGL